MGWKAVLGFFFLLIIVSLLGFYWFIPHNATEFEFGTEPRNYNFSLSNSELENMQFYPNMRYTDASISYRISDKCTLKKRNDAEQAFKILESLTLLNFYPVDSNEEISVSCQEKTKIENGVYIAGEGGATKVVATKEFNVIFNGEVLLIRSSNCENPNIAIHEILHALGFDHSNNKNNIMYEITSCEQTIGEDIPSLINELYSIPSYADLSLEDASLVMRGKYLDINMTIKNDGLKDSEEAVIRIYADDKIIKEFDLDPIKIGEGKIISLSNSWISKINIEEFKISIDTDFNELEKENNKITLKIKE